MSGEADFSKTGMGSCSVLTRFESEEVQLPFQGADGSNPSFRSVSGEALAEKFEDHQLRELHQLVRGNASFLREVAGFPFQF